LISYVCLPSSEFTNGFQRTQVQLAGENVGVVRLPDDVLAGLFTSVHIPAGHVHGSSALGNLQDCLLADSRVGTGDNEYLARFIGLLGELTALHVFPEIQSWDIVFSSVVTSNGDSFEYYSYGA